MLRCSCSRIVGSWVANPGERQAKPTSCMPSPVPSRAVSGLADVREVSGCGLDADPPLERSSLRGRCRAVDSSGEPAGSFLTMILGGCPARALHSDQRPTSREWCIRKTYDRGDTRSSAPCLGDASLDPGGGGGGGGGALLDAGLAGAAAEACGSRLVADDADEDDDGARFGYPLGLTSRSMAGGGSGVAAGGATAVDMKDRRLGRV